MYKIKKYSYDKAQKLGLIIIPSQIKNYKIDIYDLDENYITSIGSLPYSDYPSYIESDGKAYADRRRELYKKRFEKTRHIVGTRSWFADQILW